MGEVSTIGLDIAKSVFQIHGVDVDGAVVIRKRVSRAKLVEFFAVLPPCLVGIEACPSAHYWSRRLGALGHRVRLLPPQFVATKSERQQSGLMLHRSRQLLVCQRTMLSNAIRHMVAKEQPVEVNATHCPQAMHHRIEQGTEH